MPPAAARATTPTRRRRRASPSRRKADLIGPDAPAISPSEKLGVDSADARTLAALPPSSVDNPRARPSWTATAIGAVFLTLFLTWMGTVYTAFVRWWDAGHQPALLVNPYWGRQPLGADEAGRVLPDTSIVGVGIPLFFAAAAAEWLAGKVVQPGREVFRLNDTLCCFSNGVLQQVLVVATKLLGCYYAVPLLTAVPFQYIYEHYRVFDVCAQWGPTAGFVVMFFARDLGYYWFHRMAHEVAFLWAVHGVHHEPSEFNYATNVSQGAIQRITSAAFYAPLALFFPPELYMLLFPMEKIYGFFTHTKLVGKMHWFIEWFWLTPSQHRVHHAGRPEKYLDKNYGEMLIIWDRMFGTYQAEDEPVVFGHVDPKHTWDPLKSQTMIWSKLWAKAQTCDSWADKARCFLKGPGWNPQTGGMYPGKDSTPYSGMKYDRDLPTNWKLYVLAHWVPNLLVAVMLLMDFKEVDTALLGKKWLAELAICGLYIVMTVHCAGVLFDRSPTAPQREACRLVLTVPFAMFMVYVRFDSWLKQRIGADGQLALVGVMVVAAVLSVMFVLDPAHRKLFKKRSIPAPDKEAVRKRVDNKKDDRIWITEAGRWFQARLDAEE